MRPRPTPKPVPGVLSVVQMAERLGMSRRRLYELIAAGKLPPPCYRLADRRPVYPPEVHEACVRVRETGVAFDGGVIIFNRRPEPISRGATAAPRRRSASVPEPPAGEHAELVAQLAMLNVQTDADAVRRSLGTCYPDGTTGIPLGEIVKTLVRHLRHAPGASGRPGG